MAERKEEKDEEEIQILAFLKNTVKIDRDDASNLASYLRREEKITEGKDISMLEPQQWKTAFIHVQLNPASKKKLLKTVNKMRESENEKPLNIDELINNPVPQITRKFYVSMVMRQQLFWRNKLVRFSLNDDRWENIDLKSGDELLCECSGSNHELSVNNIKFPVPYESEVNEDDDSQFILVQVHCTKSVILHTITKHQHCSTFL
ncbi:hypothetical protein RFI_12542 [Reticulomyxa filosa]|uniref:Uncharacterized protein n=1 Tax=Reticulomyxa filosa TaxID=46433 RepID=X6NF41_RETFI|nr:hypothetical protein RFI_12542 [Reticulomyxa filosa]|eukprot:ETO24616.1 hypothetical protein RFI_12542 [Reticulomyxa filosa]